jgi:hypothetical protein
MSVADRWRARRSGDEGYAPVPSDRSDTSTLTSSELITMYERMSVIRSARRRQLWGPAGPSALLT